MTALEQLLYETSNACETDPDASFEVSPSRKMEASKLLADFGVTEDRSVVALCPGSINSRAKRWPAELFAALADRLLEERRQVLLVGSASEADVTTEVTTRMFQKRPTLSSKLLNL